MNNTPDYNIEEMLELIKKLPEPQRTEILRFVCASLYKEDGVIKSRMQDYCESLNKQVGYCMTDESPKMKTADMYDYIICRMKERLLREGYKLSGKSLFYRYSLDKSMASGMMIYRSAGNSGGVCFTIQVGAFSVDDIPDFYGDRLTVAKIKEYLYGGERIGLICRGHDYWYRFSDDSVAGLDINRYYAEAIEPDIEKVIPYLDERVEEVKKRRKSNQI